MKVKRTPIYEQVIVGWQITCPTCGTVFQSKLERATYCSDNCRVTAFLRKKRARERKASRRRR